MDRRIIITTEVSTYRGTIDDNDVVHITERQVKDGDVDERRYVGTVKLSDVTASLDHNDPVARRFSVTRDPGSEGWYDTFTVSFVESVDIIDVIDMTPTQEGYAATAHLFLEQVVKDIRLHRRDDDKHILASLLDIVGYLGQQGRRDLVEGIIKSIGADL